MFTKEIVNKSDKTLNEKTNCILKNKLNSVIKTALTVFMVKYW